MKKAIAILFVMLAQFAAFAQKDGQAGQQAAAAFPLKIKAGHTLQFSFKDYEGDVDLTAKVATLKPVVRVEWAKSNKYKDAGVLVAGKAATDGAINLITTFVSQNEPVDLVDQLPGFLLSQKTFSELTSSGKSLIRFDCNMKCEELKYTGSENYTVIWEGKKQQISVIRATYGTFGDDMLIMDDPDFPMVVKLNGLAKWELGEVK